jgi:hypothetical protein
MSWAPQIPLKDGLMRTIAYFEHLLTEQGIRAALAQETPHVQ